MGTPEWIFVGVLAAMIVLGVGAFAWIKKSLKAQGDAQAAEARRHETERAAEAARHAGERAAEAARHAAAERRWAAEDARRDRVANLRHDANMLLLGLPAERSAPARPAPSVVPARRNHLRAASPLAAFAALCLGGLVWLWQQVRTLAVLHPAAFALTTGTAVVVAAVAVPVVIVTTSPQPDTAPRPEPPQTVTRTVTAPPATTTPTTTSPAPTTEPGELGELSTTTVPAPAVSSSAPGTTAAAILDDDSGVPSTGQAPVTTTRRNPRVQPSPTPTATQDPPPPPPGGPPPRGVDPAGRVCSLDLPVHPVAELGVLCG